jgi:exosome complex exonuclease RRP6
MEQPPAVAHLLATLEAALLAPTTAASQLPDASDLGFERSLSRPFARDLDKESARILQLVSNVLNWSQGGKGNDLDGDLVRDGEYRNVVERVEPLLEGADDGIEKHLGIGKTKQGVGAVGAKSAEQLQQQNSVTNARARLAPHLLHASDLARPQLLFPPRLILPRPAVDAIATSEPFWKPVLRQKPHAASADSWLHTELCTPSDRFSSITPTTPPPYLRYIHPYAAELSTLSPPSRYFVAPPQPSKPNEKSFDETPFEWVGDKIGLTKMIKEIRQAGEDGTQRELAIDLEHHDYRSWGGLTCLIQVTRDAAKDGGKGREANGLTFCS